MLVLSCQKQTTNCDSIQKARASSNGPVTIGDSIKIHTQEVGGFRIYSWIGPDHFMSQQPRNTIYDAQLKNEGWYYLSVSNNECDTRIDSVYVDIELKQGTPSCSVTNNSCAYNNMGNDTYSSVQKLYDPTTQFLTLQGSGTNTLDINFHHYWKTREPEDGIYETLNVPSFGIDGNYNKVFISTIKNHFITFACLTF